MQAGQYQRSGSLISLFVLSLTLAASNVALGQVFHTDHLKCYKVTADGSKGTIKVPQLTTPQFGDPDGIEKECVVSNKSAFLCAPTEKCVQTSAGNFECDDQAQDLKPEQDFLCYKLRCPSTLTKRVRILDQFSPNGRILKIQNEQMLCTPLERKEVLPCGPIPGTNQCGGECPQTPGALSLVCKTSTVAGGCACVPQ